MFENETQHKILATAVTKHAFGGPLLLMEAPFRYPLLIRMSYISFLQYELRWVDDTHAIALFHTRAAAEAALAHDGFRSIKLRPLEAATPDSREKAELCISKAGEATAAAAMAG